MSWRGTVFFIVSSVSAYAGDGISPDHLYRGGTLEETTISEVAGAFEPGTIVIVSELHTLASHHAKQVEFLRTLSAVQKAQPISVGMEFFQYIFQNRVNDFFYGALSEPDFLAAIGWRGRFEFYREQVLFPRRTGGAAVALNAPASLTSKVAREGLSSLGEEERRLMPPNFELGNRPYFERFRETMEDGHIPPEKLENYFAAQSIWDDTMAWKAVGFIKENPNQILMIIVGDFHAIYGGGLPSRIRARGHSKVAIISQVNLFGLTESEIADSVSVHPNWGQRADWIWTSSEEVHEKILPPLYVGFN